MFTSLFIKLSAQLGAHGSEQQTPFDLLAVQQRARVFTGGLKAQPGTKSPEPVLTNQPPKDLSYPFQKV